MKLVTFASNEQTRLGVLQTTAAGDVVVDLNRADPGLPADMMAFLNSGPAALGLAADAVATAPDSAAMPLSAVTLKAPIARPGKILCIGLNYKEHAAEQHETLPKFPVIFAKYNNCVIGPNEAVVAPKIVQKLDYEAELGVVIGRRAKNVAVADALSYVAGYMCFNDVSARDFQKRVSQWTTGKSFDTFAPTGPALVTADEISDPQNLAISLSIDGEVMQQSSTSRMIFPVAELIAYVTSVMTLEPGDIIATGTPSGVGDGRNPQRWLKPGETVRVEIEHVGALENPIVAET